MRIREFSVVVWVEVGSAEAGWRGSVVGLEDRVLERARDCLFV